VFAGPHPEADGEVSGDRRHHRQPPDDHIGEIGLTTADGADVTPATWAYARRGGTR